MELKMERKWKNGRGKIIKRRQVPYKFKKYETYLKKARWRTAEEMIEYTHKAIPAVEEPFPWYVINLNTRWII